jgi:hypothetical protein
MKDKIKILFIYYLYKMIGTRVKIKDIYEDLRTENDAIFEADSVMIALNTIKTKWIKEISYNRLIAVLMKLIDLKAGVKICSVNWDIEDFKEAVELLYHTKIIFYENELLSGDNIIKSKSTEGLSYHWLGLLVSLLIEEINK